MENNVPDIQPERLYTASEVGKLIGKHSRTVRRYVDRGLFPNCQRLGPQGQHFIPGSDILDFLNEQIK